MSNQTEIEVPVVTHYVCQDCGEMDRDRGNGKDAPLDLFCSRRYDGNHNKGATMIKVGEEPRH